MSVTLCTFNVNNLFLRYKFGNKFAGDVSGKSMVDNVGWVTCRSTSRTCSRCSRPSSARWHRAR